MRTICLVLCIAAVGFASFAAARAETMEADDCAELAATENASLDDLVGAGCELSAAQISELMDNPVGELVSVPLQFDRLTVTEPVGGRELTIETTKLIPTFPTKLGDDWTLINRVVIPYVDVPVDAAALGVPGLRPDVPLLEGAGVPASLFSGSTSGLGDLTYVGLVTPREAIEVGAGKVIWAVGPTVVLPTATEDILGQGQYQLGPALALGYLGQRWTVGALAQHWWSVGGDNERPSVNQTNVQYFVYYKLGNQWSLGASPNISLDWSGDGSPAINAPIGIGINKTLFIGKLPVRIGLEATRYVVHEGNISPDWGIRLSLTPVVPSAFLK